MRVFVGTSGYSYKEWKGSFYPGDLPAAGMLRFYAEHFSTVEINNTFYRMPKESVVAEWANQVPDDFVFTLKAPQRITHQLRLKAADDVTAYFFRVAQLLGPKFGPALFQLPPFFRKDRDVLAAFLRTLPAGGRIAFEFRHESWFDEEIYALLREHKVALCAAHTEKGATPLVATASFGYLRLRDVDYPREDLARWCQDIRQTGWGEVFVYFKHEDEGRGPELARAFLQVWSGSS